MCAVRELLNVVDKVSITNYDTLVESGAAENNVDSRCGI
jgi:hypothetical protein